MYEDRITVSFYPWIFCQGLLVVKFKQEAERSREAQKMDLTGMKIINTLRYCENRELQQLSIDIGFTQDHSEMGGWGKDVIFSPRSLYILNVILQNYNI